MPKLNKCKAKINLHQPNDIYFTRLKAGGERVVRGWDGWAASPSQWTWVWASSRSWWWTRKTGLWQSMRLQEVAHNWATELNWTWNQHITSIKCFYIMLKFQRLDFVMKCSYSHAVSLLCSFKLAKNSTQGSLIQKK